MRTIRKISEGIAGWLLYEFHCMNADMFDEKYLTKPIGNILKAEYGNRVVAEYDHPILNRFKKGRGRPPQIDLVIKDDDGKLIAAVESKWYGNSPVKVKDIMWDLVRLEIIRHEYDIPCFFVLGGMKKRLNNLFASQSFLEPKILGKVRPLLTTSKYGSNSFNLTHSTKRNRFIRKKFSQYSDLRVPEKISVQSPSYYPKHGKNSDHQIFAWEVLSNKSVNRFTPSQSVLYK